MDFPLDKSAFRPGGDDIESVRLNEGRGRFVVEAKTASGGAGTTLLLKGDVTHLALLTCMSGCNIIQSGSSFQCLILSYKLSCKVYIYEMQILYVLHLGGSALLTSYSERNDPRLY